MKKGGMATHGDSEHEGKAAGKGEFANMPKEVKMQMYPKNRYAADSQHDDIKRIDGEINRSESKRKSYMSNQH